MSMLVDQTLVCRCYSKVTSSKRSSSGVPQRLKPHCKPIIYGTAEAVPLHTVEPPCIRRFMAGLKPCPYTRLKPCPFRSSGAL